MCAAANVAYDHRVETLVAKERWRWFCGLNPWRPHDGELQDLWAEPLLPCEDDVVDELCLVTRGMQRSTSRLYWS